MKDLIERLRVNGVHTLLAQFTDIHGVAKGKLVPLTHFDELLTDGAGFAGPSIPGTGLPRTGPARRVLRPRQCQHRHARCRGCRASPASSATASSPANPSTPARARC